MSQLMLVPILYQLALVIVRNLRSKGITLYFFIFISLSQFLKLLQKIYLNENYLSCFHFNLEKKVFILKQFISYYIQINANFQNIFFVFILSSSFKVFFTVNPLLVYVCLFRVQLSSNFIPFSKITIKLHKKQ